MKSVVLFASLFVLLCLSVVAMALPVTVDFSALGSTPVDITTPSSYSLNGVTFRYDDFESGVDTAQIDAAGIFGSTYGMLVLEFDAPVKALSFDFSLLGFTEPEDVYEALFVTLKNGGEDVDDVLAPSIFTPYDPGDLAQGGDGNGVFAYSNGAFDRAFMFFSTDAPYFSVSNVSYELVNTVPEPGAGAVMITGLVTLPGLRLLRRRR